jgi:superfamily I DNA/RNA helicase
MHRAKGLEFKAVVVMGCEKGQLPHGAVLKNLGDPADLDAAREQERNLLYVACTRARERLLITYTGAPSEFLNPPPSHQKI